MRGHHRERISRGRARDGARLTLAGRWVFGHPHVHPAWSLLERRCHDPLLAVSLEEVLDGSRSPFVPPRGSWCIPAAAPVKGRFATDPRSAGLAATAAGGKHASSVLPAPALRRRAILEAREEIPMSRTALAVGIVPARRPGCPVARRCSSIRFIPGTLRRPCDGTLARGTARGKLNPAGREITPEAQLTDRAGRAPVFAAPQAASSPRHSASLPPGASRLKYHGGIATGRGCGVARGRTPASSLQQVTERKAAK
jgi:hypothetical protein